MLDTRIAHTKAQSQMLGRGLQQFQDGIDNPDLTELARKLLNEYHASLRAMARSER